MRRVFTYELLDAGWARIRVEYGEKYYECVFSYLYDSMKEFSGAILKLHNRVKEASVSFMDEPGEFRILFHLDLNAGFVMVTCLWHDETYACYNKVISEYKTMFMFKIKLYTLISNVFDIFDKTYIEYGEKGYGERWGAHPFPTENYLKLKSVMERIEYFN